MYVTNCFAYGTAIIGIVPIYNNVGLEISGVGDVKIHTTLSREQAQEVVNKLQAFLGDGKTKAPVRQTEAQNQEVTA